mmetsp:Transcript_23724/g.11430  ORF Transcript_23724/g.11430 Transcript_23724/m.11430 type:complete len:318 (+) Transcript_23724:49-1002(+)
MKIASKICDMFDIKYPILLGGMLGITHAKMVTAVGNAGGLGFISSGGMNPVDLRKEIQKTRSALKEYPFGVNLLLKDSNIEKHVAVVIEEQVSVVSTGAGNTEAFLPRFKKAGIRIMPVVASCTLAVRMEVLGADAIIVEGTEAGGHIGEMTTLTLVPQVADKVSIPVVAAGGIGDTRGMLSALLLGAEAVQIGTLFLSASECPIHSKYKEIVINATDRSTVVTGRSVGLPVRAIKNKLTRQIKKMETQHASVEEVNKYRYGKLRSAIIEGDVKFGSLMCGQVAGLIDYERSVEEIFNDLLKPIHSELQRRLLYRLQ